MAVFTRYAMLAVAVAVLAGCETMNTAMSGVRDRIARIDMPSFGAKDEAVAVQQTLVAAQPVDCPRVGVVDELNSLTQFMDDGSSTSPSQEISSARITSINSQCAINESNVILDMDIHFEGQLGPRAKILSTDKPSFAYPYFLAITTPTGDISAKEVFAATLSYDADSQTVTHIEQMRQVIPLSGAYYAHDYEILVGFQLTEAELAFNRLNGTIPATITSVPAPSVPVSAPVAADMPPPDMPPPDDMAQAVDMPPPLPPEAAPVALDITYSDGDGSDVIYADSAPAGAQAQVDIVTPRTPPPVTYSAPPVTLPAPDPLPEPEPQYIPAPESPPAPAMQEHTAPPAPQGRVIPRVDDDTGY